MLDSLNKNGKIVIEEPDMSGIVHYPYNKFMDEGQKLFNRCIQSQGADINIGYKIPQMLNQLGVENIQVSIQQDCFMLGQLKCTLHAVLKNSTETIIQQKLATQEHLDRLIREITSYVNQKETLVTRPRFFQIFGTKTSETTK